MTYPYVDPDDIRSQAVGHATIHLEYNGFCTCAGQVQMIARYLEPVIAACYAFALSQDSVQVEWITAGVIYAASDQALERFAKHLHRTGASALPGSKESKAERGIDEHC